jgi:mRNA interferase HigB
VRLDDIRVVYLQDVVAFRNRPPTTDQPISLIVKRYGLNAGVSQRVTAHMLRDSCSTPATEGGSEPRQKHLVTGLVTAYTYHMRVVAKKTLRGFWREYPDAEQPLRAWHEMARAARWRTPAQLKAQLRTASLVGKDRVVFNIAGNKYRLVVAVNYRYQALYIRFVGTHAQYDQITAVEV